MNEKIVSKKGGFGTRVRELRKRKGITQNDLKHIVSFNCRHLVNDRRIDGFNAINIRCGYDHMVDISTPHKFVIKDEEDNL